MKIGFYTDKDICDSNKLLIVEGIRRGHDVYLFDEIILGDLMGTSMKYPRGCITFSDPELNSSDLDKLVDLDEFDLLIFRKLPPVDHGLMRSLDVFFDKNICINSPKIIDLDTKEYMKNFEEFCPESFYLSDKKEAVDAIYHLGKSVIKPIDGFGGKDIHILDVDKYSRSDICKIVSEVYDNNPDGIVVQRYLSASEQGDKRVYVLDGEFLGCYMRVPNGGLCNLMAGGYPAPCELTDKEREIIKSVGPKLIEDGGYLVGLDFIGEYLTESNSTVPGGIRSMNQFLPYGKKMIEERIFDLAEDIVSR